MPKLIKTTNSKCRAFVKVRASFTNSNGQLFGVWHNPMLYVVYSYGEHWPLFMWDGFDWYENEDKCSRTTSKHHGQAHPHTPTLKRNCGWLKNFISAHRHNQAKLERFIKEAA